MIKRIIDSKLPAIVYNPPRVFEINYFKECFKAGALPVFDTEFFDTAQVIDILKEMSAEDLLFGVRVYAHNKEIIDYLNNNFIINLDVVVYAYNKAEQLDTINADNRYKAIVEVIDTRINDILDKFNPNALIVKGNEAPGKISKYTSYILLQWYMENTEYPVFVHGGVGRYTSAGMFAAGASGLVLDDQLYLSDEAPLSDNFKTLLEKIEENDSAVIGQTLGNQYRFFAKLATQAVKELKNSESNLLNNKDADQKMYAEIISKSIALNDAAVTPVQSLFYLGQDAVFARHFSAETKKVAEIIKGLFKNIGEMLVEVDEHDPMVKGSGLAKEHGTKYPVIQGPMANICDNVDFAKAVYDAGGLPFFALGSLPENLAEDILKSGKEKVASFGAGLIGLEAFNSIVQTHLKLVKKYKAPFALFAGGIPSQVKELEEAGTKTYLHTPSVKMMENGINNGCTRFIFEGREAGGHIGTLSSMVLWEMGIYKLKTRFHDDLHDKSIIFAGGISTKTGSNFISGMTSRLSKMGAAVGIQAGTSYLFTKEAVKTGAVKGLYQKLLKEHSETIVTGATVGLSSRTLVTPFSRGMIEREYVRIKDGTPLAERKSSFEHENIGSLLIGAKAMAPNFSTPGKVTLDKFDEKKQFEKGNFMAGDALVFDQTVITIKDLHDRYINSKVELSNNLGILEAFSSESNRINDEIAVVGMGCIYPESNNPEEFWQNIISKKYFIKKVPNDRLNEEFYYSSDHGAQDKAYSQIGGVIEQFVFDYKKFGISKEESENMARSQKLLLESAFQAVKNAGYYKGKNKFPKQKTSVIMGTCLGNEYGDDLQHKHHLPEIKHYLKQVPEFQSLSKEHKETIEMDLSKALAKNYTAKLPTGAALNVEASRIAQFFELEGINYTVDAACATSFAAIDNARKELLLGESDVAIAGGVNSILCPEAYVGFCKMGALSNDGSFPFDERSNGFTLGEGAGVFVLKRMKDAIRDKDNVIAVLKGIGGSSDGKGKAIAAPQVRGQSYAIERCFESMQGRVTYEDIDFIEAHGTSTIAGDAAELITLKQTYKSSSPIGISSAKSMIGHLLGGAGAAGMVTAVLAVKNKILPPNGQFKKVNPKHGLDESCFYIVENATEWKVAGDKPRLAGISSYGFGGINYHLVVGEYDKKYQPLKRTIFQNLDYDFNDDRIVVAGIGVVVPGALNTEQMWKNLVGGKEYISDVPESRFHNEAFMEAENEYHLPKLKLGIVDNFKFNSLKYRIPPSVVRSIDRAQLFALDTTDQAVNESGLRENLVNGNNVGVIIGTSASEAHSEHIMRTRIPLLQKTINDAAGIDAGVKAKVADGLAIKLKERYVVNNEDTIPGLLSNIVSGRVANFYNCNGKSYTVESECASSAVAIAAAVKDLKAKDCDFIITGGVDTNLSPSTLTAFKMIKVLARSKGRFFDKNAEGLLMGEGGALMVLTTYKKAREKNMPVLGELSPFTFQSYGFENMLAPTEAGFSRIFDKFYKDNAMQKKHLDYIDVFGASHKLIDGWENKALSGAFVHDLYFGNCKSEIGYFRAANPAVVIAKLMMMAKNRQILPTNGYYAESTLINENSILRPAEKVIELSKNEVVNLGANFSSLGGNVGHTVVSTLPKWLESKNAKIVSTETSQAEPVTQVSTIGSAASAAAQRVVAKAVVQPAQSVRPAVAARSMAPITGNKVTALLSGQSAQYGGMMKELYASNAEIKTLMDKGEAIFKAQRGFSLLDLMFGEGGDQLDSTENTQPAIFLSSAAIYSYLKIKGFNPDFFIGHSLGECSALYCAGVISFEDAMQLILKRSELMKRTAETTNGRIMVLFKDAEESDVLLKKSGLNNVFIANKNSSNQTAVSGRAAEIDNFCDFLKKEGVMFRKLALSGAFHTVYFKGAADGLAEFLRGISFDTTNCSKIISNVTGEPYPIDANAVKDLLFRQIVSPVEYIKSIEKVASLGTKHYIEIGPDKILINLLKNINVDTTNSIPAIDAKMGTMTSFAKLEAYLNENNLLGDVMSPSEISSALSSSEEPVYTDSDDFNTFMQSNQSELKKIMYQEFLKHKKEQAFKMVEGQGLYTGKVVIAGTAVGLPGTANKIFSPDNFDRILNGENCIEAVSKEEQLKIVDKNIVRVFKDPQGNAKFVDINNTDDVVHLAGRLGYFDLKDYGVDYDYDITYKLAIAAGFEALKDANIPLVRSYKKTSTGKILPNGFNLPAEMENTTGVIFTSLFPGLETMINEIVGYYTDKFQAGPLEEFEKLYHFLMEKVTDAPVKQQLTDWFFKLKKSEKKEKYSFNRNLLVQIISLGSAHFAQIIKAKGPNTQVSAACASTTQAVGIAEDWIRMGRCERVIVIGGEDATSETQNQWIASGFLALGAASVKKTVNEAVKPFDESRNGMVVGSGAVAIIVERQDLVNQRGLNGQAEILGTYIGNSAFHASKIDVNHLAEEMQFFIKKIERKYGMTKDSYSKSMVFMSHETYTPARGGSADAEVAALKSAFPNHYKNITITNTKGYTGHTLGAGIEDAVMIKALQKGIVPPIANLINIPAHFADLHFSKGEKGNYEYGFHLAAGFGSHFAFLFIKRVSENSVENNAQYFKWLQKISGSANPELIIKKNTLCLESDGLPINAPAKESVAVNAPVQSSAPVQVTAPVQVAAPAIAAPADPGSSTIMKDIKDIIAEQTGYTEDMLEDDLDLEADLGIDTVKQVEIFGKIAEHYRVQVPEDLKLTDLNTINKLGEYMATQAGVSVAASAPVKTSTPAPVAAPVAAVPAGSGSSTIMKDIKGIIAEQTGYTEDMLEDDLDLEADLGIDTVKQVEIFGKVAEHYRVQVPEDLKLSDLNTIAKLSEYMATQAGVSVAPVAAPVTATAAPVQTGAVASVNTSGVLKEIKGIIAEQTGYTEDMLEDDLDLEADLGIDTVKQVEIFGKVAGNFGLDVPEDLKLSDLNTIAKLSEYMALNTGAVSAPAVITPVSAAAVSAAPAQAVVSSGAADGSILNKVKEIIAEQTGYTKDMLEDDLDLEADLGIDTVKQVEIFGKVSGSFGLDVPEDLKLSDLNTISKLAVYLGAQVGTPASSAPAPVVAAPTTASAPVQSADAAQSAVSTESQEVVNKIKEIIAEQTGYTEDMLEDDLDLEADLGIDTVKQVEVFGKVSEKFGLEVPEDLKLSDLNTIAKLGEYIAAQKGGASVTPTAATPAASTVSETPAEQIELNADGDPAGCFRFVTDLKKAPIKYKDENIFKGKKYLVTVDKHGFAKKIISKIKALEGKVITIGNEETSDIKVDFTNIAAFESKIQEVAKDHADINGFLHYLPLNFYFSKSEVNAKELNASIKTTFLTLKHLYNSLDKAGSLISLLSFESILFPYAKDFVKDKVKIHPAIAGICGMLKTANKELKDTLVKVVDFSDPDPLKNMDAIVDQYFKELMSGSKNVETGYKSGERLIFKLFVKEAEKGESFVKDGDVLMATGGAGGITFEIMKNVVQKYKLKKLIICDIQDLENADPEMLKESITEKDVMLKMKEQMPGAKPLEIKNAVGKIMRLKLTDKNINELKALCSVDYQRMDVNNSKLVKEVFDKYERIDGVLHAAGMERSQFIPKKELSDFNLVFNTKVNGLLNILKALKGKEYKYLLTFSSVTARFGNEGQVDYTGANDFLCKTLQREQVANPEKNYKTMSWTAWGGTGMAMNPTVKKVLEARGLPFLPLEQGIQFFIEELNDHKFSEAVFTGYARSFDPDKIVVYSSASEGIAEFLDKKIKKDATSATYSRVLDLKRDLFLFNHSREEVPIFLGATGLESMAEAVETIVPKGHHLVEVLNFQIPYGIKILKGRPKEIIFDVNSTDKPNLYNAKITSQFKNKDGKVMGKETLHYHADYVFTKDPLAAVKIEIPKFSPIEFKGDSFQNLIYHPKRLFMDGLFRTVEELLSFGEEILITRICDSSDREFFAGNTEPDFLTNVPIVDAMFQTGGMLEVLTTNDIILPYNLRSMKVYKKPEKNVKYICITRKDKSSGKDNMYQLQLIDEKGNLFVEMKNFEMVKITVLEEEFQILDQIKSKAAAGV